MPGYKVKVLAHSVSPDGVPLMSIAYQAPRPCLPEFNTHRAISKLAESSRARPFSSKVREVLTEPYFPADLPDGELLGESKGMQATAPIDPKDKAEGQRLYRELAGIAAKYAQMIADHGFHKQDVNRLLEPFSWTRGVVTATNWANFFALRCHYMAYPPFRYLARCIWVAASRSTPTPLNWGEWHLPFITDADREEAAKRRVNALHNIGAPPYGFDNWADLFLARWSAARTARVSLYQFGRRVLDWDKDDETYTKLAGSFPVHASPLENPALCAKAGSIQRGFPLSNFRAPWVQLRKFVQGETVHECTFPDEEVASWKIPESVYDGEPSDW